MNDPTDTGGLTNEVGQNVWGPICANASGGIVGVNDPTCVTRETQDLQANSAQDWQVTANIPTNPSGAVTTYPNAWAHGYGGVLDDYTSLTTSSSVTMPNLPNIVGHAMYDNWLTEPTSSNAYDYEVMFQYDHVNDGSCPATAVNDGTKWNWGVVATDVVFDGAPWFLCDGQVDRAGGVCPSTGCGAVVWLPGTSPSSPVSESSVTIDLKAMYQWLETHDPPGLTYPYITPGSTVASISSGFELSSTGGVAETFGMNKFTVSATGSPG